MWGGMQLGQVFGDGEYEIVSSAPIGKGSGGTVYVTAPALDQQRRSACALWTVELCSDRTSTWAVGDECDIACTCRYRGVRRATNTPVAVKCIDRLDVDCDPQKVRQLEREMNIAIKLRHQNIVNLIDVKFEEEVVLMVSEARRTRFCGSCG